MKILTLGHSLAVDSCHMLNLVAATEGFEGQLDIGTLYHSGCRLSRHAENLEKDAVDYSRNVLKPTGVPTIYIDGQKVELSEYSKEEMIRLLLGAPSVSGGFCCGEAGCG